MALEQDFSDKIDRAREGDAEALDQLFSAFYPRVQVLVHRSLATDIRAKRPWIGAMFSTGDVVQEVFMSVLRDIGDFQGATEDDFAGYLATLTRNRLIDAVRFHEAVRRDRRRVEDVDKHPVTDGARDVAEAAGTRDELARYARVLGTFGERERALLNSRLDTEGQPPTFETLAGQLGYPSADAARKAFYAAQARLLLRLGEAHSD